MLIFLSVLVRENRDGFSQDFSYGSIIYIFSNDLNF